MSIAPLVIEPFGGDEQGKIIDDLERGQPMLAAEYSGQKVQARIARPAAKTQ